MSSPVVTPLPKSVKTWAVVGFVFAGIYLLAAFVNFSIGAKAYQWIGFLALGVALLFGVGSLLALNQQYSWARVLLLIGGVIGLPLGLVMIAAANHMKKILLALPVDATISDPVEVPLEAERLEPMSFGARFAGIFLSPGSTFVDIVRKPGWLAPMLALVAPVVLFTEAMLWRIGMDRIIRMWFEQSPRAAQMAPEQVEQAVTQGARIGAIFTHAGALLGTPIFMLIVAGLGLLIVNAIFGKDLEFPVAFSVTCYSHLPSILASLMGLAMIFLGDVERFNVQNPIPTNPGFFLNPLETSKPLYVLASSLDIFTIWFLVLLGIGFSAATGRKVKSSSIFACFAGLWIVWVLIKLGFTLVM
jgi:hypothetical protein